MQDDRAAILSQMQSGFQELTAAVARIPLGWLEQPDSIGDWSVKDVLAHMPGYERYVAAEIVSTVTGRPVTPFERYGREDAPTQADSSSNDATNAWVVEFWRAKPLAGVLFELAEGHYRLVRAVEACPESLLHDPLGIASFEGRSLAALLPNQCWSHHRSHLREIESWLEERGALDGPAR